MNSKEVTPTRSLNLGGIPYPRFRVQCSLYFSSHLTEGRWGFLPWGSWGRGGPPRISLGAWKTRCFTAPDRPLAAGMVMNILSRQNSRPLRTPGPGRAVISSQGDPDWLFPTPCSPPPRPSCESQFGIPGKSQVAGSGVCLKGTEPRWRESWLKCGFMTRPRPGETQPETLG